jgi:MazG family protein
VHAKLVRRHPHVFGEALAETPGEVRHRWEHIKREQERREGVFHDVPASLPALMHARKVQRRAAAVGFEYPDLGGAVGDFESELEELRGELAGKPEPLAERPPDPRVAAELGDVLFAAVNVARRLNVDPELELRRASARFVDRVERAEQLAAEHGETWTKLDLERQDHWYDLAKEEGK